MVFVFSTVDTKNSPAKDLMLLALKMIEHAVSKQETIDSSVSLSLYIIEVMLYNIVLIHILTIYINFKNLILHYYICIKWFI